MQLAGNLSTLELSLPLTLEVLGGGALLFSSIASRALRWAGIWSHRRRHSLIPSAMARIRAALSGLPERNSCVQLRLVPAEQVTSCVQQAHHAAAPDGG